MRLDRKNVFKHFKVALILVYFIYLVVGHVILCHVTMCAIPD